MTLAAARSACAGVFVQEARSSSQLLRWLWQRKELEFGQYNYLAAAACLIALLSVYVDSIS